VDEVFEKLRDSVRRLEAAIGTEEHAEQALSARILAERTTRIAREPVRVERSDESLTCMVFQRCGHSYAVPLEALSDVGPITCVAHVPGVPEAFLGVTARRGRVVSVVDIPRLFGSDTADAPRPKWLVMTSSSAAVCGVGADELHDIIDVDPASMAKAMPTFPALIQRHTVGVLENRTVILDLVGLLEDRVLRVEDRVT
jgi:purine-binding chemotaxis protein CheW